MDDKTTFDIGSEKEFRPVRVPVEDDGDARAALDEINADKAWEFESATAIEVYGVPYVVYLFSRTRGVLPLG
jgi:hypothetical protein